MSNNESIEEILEKIDFLNDPVDLISHPKINEELALKIIKKTKDKVLVYRSFEFSYNAKIDLLISDILECTDPGVYSLRKEIVKSTIFLESDLNDLYLSETSFQTVREIICANYNHFSVKNLEMMLFKHSQENFTLLKRIVGNSNYLDFLIANYDKFSVSQKIKMAKTKETPIDILNKIIDDEDPFVRSSLINSPHVNLFMEKLLLDKDLIVKNNLNKDFAYKIDPKFKELVKDHLKGTKKINLSPLFFSKEKETVLPKILYRATTFEIPENVVLNVGDKVILKNRFMPFSKNIRVSNRFLESGFSNRPNMYSILVSFTPENFDNIVVDFEQTDLYDEDHFIEEREVMISGPVECEVLFIKKLNYKT